MIIRRNQLRALEDLPTRNFEDEMTRHLYEFSPRHCNVIEETGVREVIRRGIAGASEYAFTKRGPVRLYLELILMFGSNFDTDPLLSWASAILNSGDSVDQMSRAEELHAKALDFSQRVAGAEHEYAKEAFRRARTIRYESLRLPPGDFESGCLTMLRAGYPQKYEYAGEPAVRDMIQRAVESARSYHISIEQGVLVFVGLMFAMGHGFAEDPLYPWVSGALNNEAISDPNKRVERVYSKAMTYLDQIIVNLA